MRENRLMATGRAIDLIARQDWLERTAGAVQPAVIRAFKAGGRAGRKGAPHRHDARTVERGGDGSLQRFALAAAARRPAGRTRLAYLGYAVSLSWAYLGGHLVFDEQIGVDHTSDKVKLKSRREIAEGTMAFHFEKPPGFAFKAGQALAWTLLDPPETDDESRMRNFSIASAPGEPDLMIATRMRDTAFKRVLKTMPLGTEVRIVGPFGSLTLRQNAARPAVFLAGGIGMTPFRSMLRQAAEQKLPHHIG